MPVVKNSDGEWMHDAGPHLVTISCHHRKRGACGGCYARLVRLAQDVAASGNEDAATVLEEMKSESKKRTAPPSSSSE